MSTTTDRVRAALADGSAHLGYHVAVTPPGCAPELWVGVYVGGGGTLGEWTIQFVSYGGHRFTRHQVHDDCIAALCAVDGYWPALDGLKTVGAVTSALAALGFRDATSTDPALLLRDEAWLSLAASTDDQPRAES